jgi:hypothetical protein
VASLGILKCYWVLYWRGLEDVLVRVEVREYGKTNLRPQEDGLGKALRVIR